MKDITLVIMAAGMGSRFGGIKQLEPVGPSNEIIMDYSVYDAIKAGFNKVVFIIRRELEADFREVIGNRIEKHIKVEYVYQEVDKFPPGIGIDNVQERDKPWGTGQAIFCCKDTVKEPFAVINADDYYGAEAFAEIYNFLSQDDLEETSYCMAGFILKNTLSDYGSVTRGICKVFEGGLLRDIDETSGIERVDGSVVAEGKTGKIEIDENSTVSMNIWGFQPSLFEPLEQEFKHFLLDSSNSQKEYLLPAVVGQLIKGGNASVNVLKIDEKWFGVTYKEDKPFVVKSIKALVDAGRYPERLFS